MLAFLASYLSDNILVIVCQLVGSYIPPILGVYLLGFFAPRVNSRNVLVAFLLNGRLPTSIEGCLSAANITQPITTSQSSNNPLLLLYSISVMWYAFNGVFLTVILSLLGTFIFGRIDFIKQNQCSYEYLGSNNPKMVDKSLLKSTDEVRELEMQTTEQERML
ncbi:unnamed protein product [Rotaria sordida]|nr:unnamed protein product [Rotaria sordida]CAF1460153.1 unnamed protein product [Rotaria sordida]